MTTQELTLEQVQANVIGATRECPDHSVVTGDSTNHAMRHVCRCSFYDGTGLVPRYPKAGEKCPRLHSVIEPAEASYTKNMRNVSCAEASCIGITPTEDMGRLLEAYVEGRPFDLLGQESNKEWRVYNGRLETRARGTTPKEALWRALYATLEAE